MDTTIKNENAGAKFKTALADKSIQIGTFQKTPSMNISEVLALTELDVICLDAEHAPFDRRDIDACIFSYRAANKPVLVRVPSDSDSELLNALDCGASGVVVPHVDSPEKARRIATKCFFGAGGRGYAGSTRFAQYTNRSVDENIKNNKAETSVICQIEDLSALDVIDEIMQVDGIDCFFIGVMDLTVALGESAANAKAVTEAIDLILSSATKYSRTVGMFVPNNKDVPYWQEKGVSLFLLGSDHNFIKQGAFALARSIKPEIDL